MLYILLYFMYILYLYNNRMYTYIYIFMVGCHFSSFLGLSFGIPLYINAIFMTVYIYIYKGEHLIRQNCIP